MSDIKFAIFNKHTIPELALDCSADPRQQSFINRGYIELID